MAESIDTVLAAARAALREEGRRLSSARARTREPMLARALVEMLTARPIDQWHEDHGPALWWRFPIEEPPYSGTPLDDDWPGYHTHWSPIPEVRAADETEAKP